MRKVFLDDLPRWKNGNINWKESIGYKVGFVYEKVKGEFTIIDYSTQKIKVKYNNKHFNIGSSALLKCLIGHIVNTEKYNYRYNVGDKLSHLNAGIVEIKNKTQKNGIRAYDYICLICSNEDTISEHHLNRNTGCNVCIGRKILRGYNDLWTTHPEIAKLLLNPEDGYLLTYGSKQRKKFKCPNCNSIQEKSINNVVKQNNVCSVCSDYNSYGEKFITYMLKELNISFKKEKIFCWSKNKRYDFYIPSTNCIIETHGRQHYEDIKMHGSKMLKEIQENDNIKKNLAIQNKIEHYIVLDIRNANIEGVVQEVLDSELIDIYDLSSIDWLNCHKFACSNITKHICDLWSSGIRDSKEIGRIMQKSSVNVVSHLKKGSLLDWCDYDPKEVVNKLRSTKVICLNTKEVFESIKEASYRYKINESGISNNCNKKSKSAGKHPETGEKLKWMHYDKYIKIISDLF